MPHKREKLDHYFSEDLIIKRLHDLYFLNLLNEYYRFKNENIVIDKTKIGKNPYQKALIDLEHEIKENEIDMDPESFLRFRRALEKNIDDLKDELSDTDQLILKYPQIKSRGYFGNFNYSYYGLRELPIHFNYITYESITKGFKEAVSEWLEELDDLQYFSNFNTAECLTKNQKVLLIRYMEALGLVSLNKIHQDNTKQARLLSQLMGISYNTLRETLGKRIVELKTDENLQALLEVISEKDFPELIKVVKDDIKNS